MVLKEKNLCTGCGACYSVCPINSVVMERDEEGFLYPHKTSTCIECGKCERICPINRNIEPLVFKQLAYAALSKVKKTWLRSASGGAFSEICKAFGDSDTLFCGAVFNGIRVHHKCVYGIENIVPLCKSKYIASNINDTFLEIKNHLLCGKKALFCGTPCQVAGLKAFLGREYENLLLIDFICHGVGSPTVFEESIALLEDQFNKKITSYEFRSKRDVFEKDHLQKLVFEDNKEIYIENDPYIQLFTKQDCLRPSCNKDCKYRNQNRLGDITIADFKGLTKVFPKLLGTKKNYSSIIFNSKKGYALFEKLNDSMIMKKCEIEDIKKYNPLFYRQTFFSQNRDNFFKDFVVSPKEAILKNSQKASISKKSLKRKIYDMLPCFIRRILIKQMEED